MDAAEDDQDVKLQRASADLLADFQNSLNPFLWKTTKSGKTRIRDRVRVRDTARLVNLLEPFQELPQLLDPHLDKFVPVLADAFLASLQAPTPTHPPANAQLLMPVSKAICKLLYTFCKIRGDKVIVRFWATDTKYLELLLAASESNTRADAPSEEEKAVGWDWEERYITLLWLSQLLLAPFDLASISSQETEDITRPDIPGLVWPSDIPTITLRAISLGIRYLSSSGKERDAAKVLLVRIAMRRDMQALGIQDALMQWAISCLRVNDDSGLSTYHYIGVLSFLAAILISSVGTTNMDSFVSQVFQVVQGISTGNSAAFTVINGSAVARKAIVKILRTIVVLVLQGQEPDDTILEFTIGHMLESLADTATPVRLAASKALSIITLKLPSDMATQVVEEVLASLNKNILWTVQPRSSARTMNLARVNPLEWHGLTLTLSHLLYRQSVASEDLKPVLDALRLSLSFEQRSTSGSSVGTNVRDAACFGIWAVARRYKTADLQNLLLFPDIEDSKASSNDGKAASALQVLANDLVVSACIDPAGNIRRGSSAALQELIGRHPNMIAEGIQVVQVVDYHAVALRVRAMNEVAIHASQLSENYHGALLRALTGWRGVRDPSPVSRKVAASTIGLLVWQRHIAESGPWVYIQGVIRSITTLIQHLDPREANERHGLILAFAAIAARVNAELTPENLHAEFHQIQGRPGEALTNVNVPADLGHETSLSKSTRSAFRTPVASNTRPAPLTPLPDFAKSGLYKTLELIDLHLKECLKQFEDLFQSSRHLDLMAEAFAELVIATSGVPRSLSLFGTFSKQHGPTDEYPHCSTECWIRKLIMEKVSFTTHQYILDTEPRLIMAFFTKTPTPSNYDILSKAVEAFGTLEDGLLAETPNSAVIINKLVSSVASMTGKKDLAYVHALIKLFPILGKVRNSVQFRNAMASAFPEAAIPDVENWQPLALEAIRQRWRRDTDVETRATILQCLARAKAAESHQTLLETHATSFIDMMKQGLQDFTTNARGDVGSLVRIAAAEAAAVVLSKLRLRPDKVSVLKEMEEKVVGGLFRTAAEKLDKVRVEGQKAVAKLNSNTGRLEREAPSSQAYFACLLSLQDQEWWAEYPRSASWGLNLLEGYVTSADTGSEDLIRASRAALVEYCNKGNGDWICGQLEIMAGSKVDRVLIPTLEVIGFLFNMQIMQKSSLNWKSFYNTIQRAHYKSSNIRKLQAAIKIYGGLMEVYPDAVTKLSSMLLHNFPGIRNAAADELWVVTGVESLKGVDWAKAKKADLERVRAELKKVS